jgi:phosphatidylglycerophosphate synthase
MNRHIPNVLTVLGLVAGVVGVALWPHLDGAVLMVVSLVLDALDGHTARALGAASFIGADLDWAADVALSQAITWRALSPPAAAAVSIWLALLQGLRVHIGAKVVHLISGRAAVFLSVLAARAFL